MKLPCNQSKKPVAKVNGQLCTTESRLRSFLKQALNRDLSRIDIVVYEPTAQRFFLPLAFYSPEEVLPQEVGRLVGDIHREQITHSRGPMQYPIGALGTSLAVTAMMREARTSASVFLATAIISAIHKGYSKISFVTSLGAWPEHDSSGSVVIRIMK